MKRNAIGLSLAVMVALAMVVVTPNAFAGNDEEWGTAGKVLAGLEGLRVLSGGNVDVIGTLTGVNRHARPTTTVTRYEVYETQPVAHYERIWAPTYEIRREYVPGHYEYRLGGQGNVYIGGHYVEYRTECGGEWIEKRVECRYHDRHDRRDRHGRRR